MGQIDHRRRRLDAFGMQRLWLVCLLACSAPLGAAVTSQQLDDGGAPDVTWDRFVVYGPSVGGSIYGADGTAWADFDGDGLPDVTSAWEESNNISLSFQPPAPTVWSGQKWPTVTMTAPCSGAEDVIPADMDGDGFIDLVAACSGGFKVMVFYAPKTHDRATLLNPSKWTAVTVAASNGLTRWLRVGAADIDGDGKIDIVASGYGNAAGSSPIGYFTSSSPRLNSGWTFHPIGIVGGIQEMEIADFDGDGRLDIRLSDRDTICQTCSADQRRYDLRGVRLLLHPVPPTPVSSTWQSVGIVGEPPVKARWHCSSSDHRTIVEGFADEGSPNTNHLQKWHLDDTGQWTKVDLDPGPSVAWYQACAIGDIDGDGLDDVALTWSHADGELEYVTWLHALPDSTYEQGSVSGPDGCKGDNVQIMQIAGRTVIVTSEQGCSGGGTPPAERIGIVVYRFGGAP
jgi:hypothetical protein